MYFSTTFNKWKKKLCPHFCLLKDWRWHPVHPLSKICSMASTLLQEFLATQSEPPAPPDPIIMQQLRPLQHNFYKMNFDAATFSSSNSVGIGVIVHDCARDVISALSMPQSVAAVEALACRRVVKFAAEIGLPQVVIEGDLAVIINALTTDNGEQTIYGNIIEDICALISGFQLVEYNHVPRACNLVADALAKKASTVTSLQVWLEDTPFNITPLVLRDVFVVRDVH